MARSFLVVAAMSLTGCVAGLHGDLFEKSAVSYRVVLPNDATWSRVAFADNDLAWVTRAGHVLAINATCEGHEDPPLDVLTRHLLFGFSERQMVESHTENVDAREALHSWWAARLDGVPVELELLVLKKNGCVHDLTYVSPKGLRAEHQAEFDALVAGFRQYGRGR